MASDSARSASNAPIAIIGIGCRFPTANSATELWKLLVEGRDAITEAPPDRFDFESVFDPTPGVPGKISSRWGGYIRGVDQFDAAFFGIAPRDAARMDPQQRHALEVAWEALEDGGQRMRDLHGSQTGVFVGVHTSEYDGLVEHPSTELDLALAIGGSRNGVAGRISYWLGLEGPSMVVDSDRSSSLVAVHLACQSLRSGETSLAIAGGTNLLLSPRLTFAFSRAGMLAPDGRCKFADARANGISRSDGVAMVVLKPLHSALADHDRIYAVIRGGAVNHDGGRSGDFMAPSAASQVALLRAACRNAGVAPHDVQYVDAHGPGTPVGDPQEVSALATVFQTGREGRAPLHVGSIKTNIGHAEASAGIASLVKVALSIHHRLIPKSLHFETPNPGIRFEGVVVQTKNEGWPDESRPLVAGVTSLGATGTNAHVILSEAPPSGRAQPPAPRCEILPLSAASRWSLLALASKFARDMRVDDDAVGSITFTAAVRRHHFAHRVAVVGSSHEELAHELAGFVETGVSGGTHRPPKVAFVFPGYGSQWVGMGRELARTEPVFAAEIERCDAAIRAVGGWSLVDELHRDAPEARMNQPEIVQPALVAIAIGLAALWRSWGVEPCAVLGASMGEVGAAHVSGALSLEDTFRIVCERSRLILRLMGKGATAIVSLSADEVRERIAGKEERVGIAANYSPSSTLVSGDPATIDELVARFTADRVYAKRIAGGNGAAHSPQMDAISPDLAIAIAGVRPKAGTIPMYSTVTGDRIAGSTLDASYWVRNGRQQIQYAATMGKLLDAGVDVFVEMSPHTLLVGPTLECIRHAQRRAVAVGSLRRGEPERRSLLRAVAELYAFGCDFDWKRISAEGAPVVALPTYEWEHRSYWWDARDDVSPAPTVGRVPRARPEESEFVAPIPLAEQLARASLADRREIIATYLRRQVAGAFGVAAESLDAERQFRELGLTSIMAVELRNTLERGLGRALPATVAWQHPTLDQLTTFLVGLDGESSANEAWVFEEVVL